MSNAELTKSRIIKSASSSLGSSLQKTRHQLGFDLDTVNRNTNIPIPSIDRLEPQTDPRHQTGAVLQPGDTH